MSGIEATTTVVGVGGRGHRDWAIAPRVVARLAADPWVRAHNVRLSVTHDLPAHLFRFTEARRLIVIRVCGTDRHPYSVTQTVIDTPPGRPHPPGSVSACAGSGFGTVAEALQLPNRIVVFTVGGCDLRPGRAAGPAADEVVRRLVAMVRRELAVPLGPAGWRRTPEAVVASC